MQVGRRQSGASPPGRSTCRDGRRGGMSPLFILAFGCIVALVALAVDSANLWQARVEMRNGADAAVLAAAQALASDDDLLTNQPGVARMVAERARLEAQAYGLANPVLGQPLAFEDHPDDPQQSDVVFGFVEDSTLRTFQLANDLESPLLNAVRVVAQRTRARGNAAGTFFARFF